MDTSNSLNSLNPQHPVLHSAPPPTLASSSVSHSLTSGREANAKRATNRLNKPGRDIRDNAIRENANNGKLEDKNFLGSIVSAIREAGNAYYSVGLFEKSIRTRNKPIAKSSKSIAQNVSEEDTLFASIDKEKRLVIKWLHIHMKVPVAEIAAVLELQQSDLKQYEQYLNEVMKSLSLEERHSLDFKLLLPSISAENKAKLQKLLEDRPDASDFMVSVWATRLGVQNAQASHYVWLLRVSGRIPRPGIIPPNSHEGALKPLQDVYGQTALRTLTPAPHLPTPSLSTSPEPHWATPTFIPPAPLLDTDFAAGRQGANCTHRSMISPVQYQRAHEPPTPVISPTQLATVKSEQSLSPAIIQHKLPSAVSDPSRSATTTPFSPQLSFRARASNDSTYKSTPSDIDMLTSEMEPPQDTSRAHSVPPAAQIEMQSPNASPRILPAIDPRIVRAATMSQASSSTSEEIDQLEDDDNNDAVPGVPDNQSGHYVLEARSLSDTEVKGIQCLPSANVVDPYGEDRKGNHTMEDDNLIVDDRSRSSIEEEPPSLGPALIPEDKTPRTIQELLDRISEYEDDIDWLIAYVDSLPAQDT